MNLDEAKAKMAKLKKQSDEIYQRYVEVREERAATKKAFRFSPDLGCECDSDFCHTEKRNEVVNAGEKDYFCHDDQDRGSLSIYCNSGEIEVVISTAVWDTPERLDSKTLRTGESWSKDIPEQSSWYDQTNIVEIRGIVASNYNLDFKSWDD